MLFAWRARERMLGHPRAGVSSVTGHAVRACSARSTSAPDYFGA
jgi:hypothetical protein